MKNTLEITNSTTKPTPEEIARDREYIFNGADQLRNKTNLFLGAKALTTEVAIVSDAPEQKDSSVE